MTYNLLITKKGYMYDTYMHLRLKSETCVGDRESGSEARQHITRKYFYTAKPLLRARPTKSLEASASRLTAHTHMCRTKGFNF